MEKSVIVTFFLIFQRSILIKFHGYEIKSQTIPINTGSGLRVAPNGKL